MWYMNSKGEQIAPLQGEDRSLLLEGACDVYRFIHGDKIATEEEIFVDSREEEDDECDGFLWNQLEGSQRFVLLHDILRSLIEEDYPPPKVFTVYHRAACWMIVEIVNGSVSCEIDEGQRPSIRSRVCEVWNSTTNQPFKLSPELNDHAAFHDALHILFVDRLLDGVDVPDELPRLPTAEETQLARKYLDCASQLADLPLDQRRMWQLAWAVSQATSWDTAEDTSGSLAPRLIFKVRDHRLYAVPYDGVSIDTIFDAHVDVNGLLSAFLGNPSCDWSQGELLVQGDFCGVRCEILLWPTTLEILRDELEDTEASG